MNHIITQKAVRAYVFKILAFAMELALIDKEDYLFPFYFKKVKILSKEVSPPYAFYCHLK